MALEVDVNGQPRAYRRRSDGSLVTVAGPPARSSPAPRTSTGSAGTERPAAVAGGSGPAARARRGRSRANWATITDTATKYLGRWSGSAIDHFDGVPAHLQFYGAELSQAQIATLARPQLVVWPRTRCAERSSRTRP